MYSTTIASRGSGRVVKSPQLWMGERPTRTGKPPVGLSMLTTSLCLSGPPRVVPIAARLTCFTSVSRLRRLSDRLRSSMASSAAAFASSAAAPPPPSPPP